MEEKENKTNEVKEINTQGGNQKKGAKNLVIISILFVIAMIIVGGYFTYDFMQKQTLISEIDKVITTVDITEDTIDIEDIKSTGRYAKIEKAIKSYLNDYAVTLQETINLVEDEQFINILTVENYEEDGPEFIETKEYLAQMKEKFSTNVEKMDQWLNEDQMMENIKKENLDAGSIALYKQLMLDEETAENLKKEQEQLKKASDKVLKVINAQEEIIDFLIENEEDWIIEGNKVVFINQTSVKKYNALVLSVKNKLS